VTARGLRRFRLADAGCGEEWGGRGLAVGHLPVEVREVAGEEPGNGLGACRELGIALGGEEVCATGEGELGLQS
jgi:hypothetical protein